MLLKINQRRNFYPCKPYGVTVSHKTTYIEEITWDEESTDYHKTLDVGSRIKIRLYHTDHDSREVLSGYGIITRIDTNIGSAIKIKTTTFVVEYCKFKRYYTKNKIDYQGKYNAKTSNYTKDR